MTVKELIAKLQEMPQDMPVYIAHDEGGHYEVHRVETDTVEDCEYEHPIINGVRHTFTSPGTQREFDAVVLS